jgi:hypothetical protein
VTVVQHGGEFGGDAVWVVAGKRAYDFTPTGHFVTGLLFGNTRLDSLATNGTRLLYLTDDHNNKVVEVRAVPPDTTITAHPRRYTLGTEAEFSFNSTETGSFQCSLVGQGGAPDLTACSSPKKYMGLSDGTYDFEVRAIDRARIVDPVPARVTFTVDNKAPQTTITSGPADGSHIGDPTPTFTFTANEPVSRFRCWHDDASFVTCTSPRTAVTLADGTHTWSVQAIDRSGNIDLSPASRTFVVDTVPPDLHVSSQPVTMTGGGVVAVDVTCPSQEISPPCSGTLGLRTAHKVDYQGQLQFVTLGSATFSIGAGATDPVHVQLSPSKQHLVKTLGTVQVKATADAHDEAGNTNTVRQVFTLHS